MRLFIISILINLPSPLLAQSESVYGKMTGVQWKEFENEASKWVEGLTVGGQKLQWDESVNQSLGDGFKLRFILGIYELAASLPSNLYWENPTDGELQYIPQGSLAPFVWNISPRQSMKGLNKFYEDYRNVNVKLLEAMIVVQMETIGESAEEVEWWTQFFRADPELKAKMQQQKHEKELETK